LVKKKVNELEPAELKEFYRAVGCLVLCIFPELKTSKLRKGTDGARGDDTGAMKKAIVSWMSQLFQASNPPLDPDVKSDRGLDHDDTGRLLCPSEYNWEDLT
jgi:hypothetical protein